MKARVAQFHPLPLVEKIPKLRNVCPQVGEERVTVREEYASQNLHPFEVVEGFVLPGEIDRHFEYVFGISV